MKNFIAKFYPPFSATNCLSLSLSRYIRSRCETAVFICRRLPRNEWPGVSRAFQRQMLTESSSSSSSSPRLSGARVLRRNSECCWTRLITAARPRILEPAGFIINLRPPSLAPVRVTSSTPPQPLSPFRLLCCRYSVAPSCKRIAPARNIPALIPLIEIYRENYSRFRGIFCAGQDFNGEKIRRAPSVRERI